MSTISSPRPSITSARTPTPPGSRRPSIEISNLTASNASTPTPRAASPSLTHRKNRAALRDYYNLRPVLPDSSQPNHSRPRSIASTSGSHYDASTHPISPSTQVELDSPNFDPSAYISRLLSTSSLSTILKAENSLISDIRTLDGERKALVYDNYSKLIKAVETIGKMRASIEERGQPMVMTKTLAPAVGFVVETAATLIRQKEESVWERDDQKEASKGGPYLEKETVKWVLNCPKRLRWLLDDGKVEEAGSDWKEVEWLLTKWQGVKGVDELRKASASSTRCQYYCMSGVGNMTSAQAANARHGVDVEAIVFSILKFSQLHKRTLRIPKLWACLMKHFHLHVISQSGSWISRHFASALE
ncbi:hypothetical protein PAAG_08362 [Paracoccidioides lutzii Pb01]|uniref:Vacuolar protein sorting-associated protein 51 homolog n=1 Tax=Paracoccidioides lutzii (strain ATCC MYA-826 / Pb01) TaxID=502779 RepID=C1HC71_PARBA|nr:hypothetical protein PAAG_08362 [Paracoccidioides lutzii Pb01]EEH38635.1 hypothetical protein PAAG_08362 [Paracoccidioides lutzii Pb01]